jgi:hypothetical protein
MTGYKQYNFPKFHRVAALLRAKGLTIISPAEQDSPAVQAAAMKSKDGTYDKDGKVGGETWGQILAKDVLLIADKIDGIIFMDGWEKSRGANLEAVTALLTDEKRPSDNRFEFYRWHDDTETFVPISRFTVLWSVSKAIEDRLKLLR